MRFLPFLLPCLLAAAFLALTTLPAAARTEISLNAGWRFHYGDTPGAEAPAFDPTAWSQVNTPHPWNALDGQDGVQKSAGSSPANIMKGGHYARDTGWYRRTLAFDPARAGRQVCLQFETANRRADVFLNGQSLGAKPAGADHIIRWPAVRLAPGKNQIRATATLAGRPFFDECTWTLAAPREVNARPGPASD